MYLANSAEERAMQMSRPALNMMSKRAFHIRRMNMSAGRPEAQKLNTVTTIFC